MTDAQVAEEAARYPHLTAGYFAYYAGRNGARCEFTSEALRADWARGRRDVKAEDRLSADTEWDTDNED